MKFIALKDLKSAVICEDSGKHWAPGIVASNGNHCWSIISDVISYRDWRRVACDKNRIRKDRAATALLGTLPRLWIDSKSSDGERTRQMYYWRHDHRYLYTIYKFCKYLYWLQLTTITGFWPSYCQISTNLDKSLHTNNIHLWADLDRDRHVDDSRPNPNNNYYVCFVIVVTNPKSYIETTDRRDFGGKPWKWGWGRVLSWKILNFVAWAEPDPKTAFLTFLGSLTHSLVDLPRWGLATADDHCDIFLLHCARSCDISFRDDWSPRDDWLPWCHFSIDLRCRTTLELPSECVMYWRRASIQDGQAPGDATVLNRFSTITSLFFIVARKE